MINLVRLARRLLFLPPQLDKVVLGITAALVVIFIGSIWYYFSPVNQSITIVARTEYVSTLTDGNPTAIWSLGNATVCIRRKENLLPSANASRAGRCDNALFESHTFTEEIDFVWPKGILLTIIAGERDEIAVSIKKSATETISPQIDGLNISDNSILLFSRSELRNTSVLFLTGEVTIGQVVQPFTRRLLRSGKYEIREKLWLRERPILSNSGDLIVGDRVQVLEKGRESGNDTLKPVMGTAFLTVPDAERKSGFDVVFTTAAIPSFVQIERAGDSVALLSTNWTQRVKNDLLPVAISTLLGLFGASLGIVRSFRR